MKKYIVSILAMLIFALPTFAQDDEVICEPDLTDSIAQLESLQSAFDETGDVDAFTTGLQEVMTALQEVKTDCTPLPEMQEAVFGNFKISYPVGWVHNSEYNTISIGTSSIAIEEFNNGNPVMPSGQFGIGVFVNFVDFFGEAPAVTGDPLQDIADMLLSDLSDETQFSFGDPVTFSINDRRVFRIDFTSSGVEAALIVADLGDGDYTVFVLGAAVGELQNYEAIVITMLESAEYTLP